MSLSSLGGKADKQGGRRCDTVNFGGGGGGVGSDDGNSRGDGGCRRRSSSDGGGSACDHESTCTSEQGLDDIILLGQLNALFFVPVCGFIAYCCIFFLLLVPILCIQMLPYS